MSWGFEMVEVELEDDDDDDEYKKLPFKRNICFALDEEKFAECLHISSSSDMLSSSCIKRH